MKHCTIAIIMVLFLSNAITLFGFGTIEATVSGGSWDVDIDATDLLPASTAGANLTTFTESATNLVDVNITITWSAATWYVTVHKVDTTWDPDVRLYAKRTGNGTGTGTINDGLNYVLVDDTPTYLFRVTRTRSNVPIELMLDEFSVPLMSSGVYTTSVVYTITNVDPR
ncbi:MAG: hypothetical protein EHM28_13095 [Spirochaetaceae bacterium]|nr:MAG: hypothetical protein EHM28_13095 [Spirochaetaceae bacterium]